MTQLSPTPPDTSRRSALWAVAAAAAVVIAIGVPLLLMRGDDVPVAATTTGAATTLAGETTLPGDTTRAPETTAAAETSQAPTTAVTTTVAPPVALVDIAGLDWVRTDSALRQVIGSDGRVVIDHPTPLTGAKSLAWDGADGLVLLGDGADLRNGDLRWVRPEADLPVPVEWTADDEGMIADVVVLDGRPVAALRSFAGEVAWFDLETGEPVAGDPDRVDYLEEGGIQLGAQGRRVAVEYPENADVERDETGALIWPFDLPELVVLDAAGAELARIELGSREQPLARVHDFDGRRVVVTVEPIEPAFPPTTAYVIDLECAECTEVVELPGADTLDLVGILDSEGPVATVWS